MTFSNGARIVVVTILLIVVVGVLIAIGVDIVNSLDQSRRKAFDYDYLPSLPDGDGIPLWEYTTEVYNGVDYRELVLADPEADGTYNWFILDPKSDHVFDAENHGCYIVSLAGEATLHLADNCSPS